MALRENGGVERADHTRLAVGDQGDPNAQEPGTGKTINRRGGTESESDINIASTAEPFDLVASGDYDSGEKNTGGAEALAGEIISDDGNTFSVAIDWVDKAGEVMISHDPDILQNVTEVDFNLIVRSDRFVVRVTDTSGAAQNNIRGTVNAH